jgi:hypothetical protein
MSIVRHLAPGRSDGGRRIPWSPTDPVYELSVEEVACWLSLEVDEREVRRVPLVLPPGQVTTVQG